MRFHVFVCGPVVLVIVRVLSLGVFFVFVFFSCMFECGVFVLCVFVRVC